MLTQATLNDLDRLEKLYHDSIGLPGCTWSEDYPTRQDAANDIEAGNLWVLRDEAGEVIAAVSAEEDEIKPFDFCTDKTPASVCIARVVVAREQQGHGLARKLVLALADELRGQGVSYIRLLVSPGNKPALATYTRAGFQKIGECDLYEHHWHACELKL